MSDPIEYEFKCPVCMYHFISGGGGMRCRQPCIRRKDKYDPEQQHWEKDFFKENEEEKEQSHGH